MRQESTVLLKDDVAISKVSAFVVCELLEVCRSDSCQVVGYLS